MPRRTGKVACRASCRNPISANFSGVSFSTPTPVFDICTCLYRCPALQLRTRVAPSVIFSCRSVPRYSRSMPISGTKRAQKMVTIHNLHEMKTAAHENDPQTKLLVLGLGEAILTTCGQARVFLGNGSLF